MAPYKLTLGYVLGRHFAVPAWDISSSIQHEHVITSITKCGDDITFPFPNTFLLWHETGSAK